MKISNILCDIYYGSDKECFNLRSWMSKRAASIHTHNFNSKKLYGYFETWNTSMKKLGEKIFNQRTGKWREKKHLNNCKQVRTKVWWGILYSVGIFKM